MKRRRNKDAVVVQAWRVLAVRRQVGWVSRVLGLGRREVTVMAPTVERAQSMMTRYDHGAWAVAVMQPA